MISIGLEQWIRLTERLPPLSFQLLEKTEINHEDLKTQSVFIVQTNFFFFFFYCLPLSCTHSVKTELGVICSGCIHHKHRVVWMLPKQQFWFLAFFFHSDKKPSIHLSQRLATMACRPDLACCLFLHGLKAQNDFIFLNSWQQVRKRIFHDMWKCYENQISVSIKFHLNTVTLSLLCAVCDRFYTVTVELNRSNQQNMAKNSIFIWT